MELKWGRNGNVFSTRDDITERAFIQCGLLGVWSDHVYYSPSRDAFLLGEFERVVRFDHYL